MTQAGSLAEVEARARALIASNRVDEPTRRVLQARLDRSFGAPRALTPDQMRTLRAICLRVIPEPELVARVDLAGALDARLADRTPRGWRYAEAPDDLILAAAGLDTLDRDAARPFADLPPHEQDDRLRHAQKGEGAFAGRLEHWFEEVLSALVELYYAHPIVQAAIGYDGMADGGDRALGLRAVAAEGEPLGL